MVKRSHQGWFVQDLHGEGNLSWDVVGKVKFRLKIVSKVKFRFKRMLVAMRGFFFDNHCSVVIVDHFSEAHINFDVNNNININIRKMSIS